MEQDAREAQPLRLATRHDVLPGRVAVEAPAFNQVVALDQFEHGQELGVGRVALDLGLRVANLLPATAWWCVL